MRSLEKIDETIGRLKEKIAEYQVRLQDLEKKRSEVENMEILQTVHEIAATPEEVRHISEMIRSAKPVKTAEPHSEKEEAVNE